MRVSVIEKIAVSMNSEWLNKIFDNSLLPTMDRVASQAGSRARNDSSF